MHISKAIYRLSKLARLLDVDGCKEDVEALNDAVVHMTQKLRDEQIEIALKHVVRPIAGRRGTRPTQIGAR